MRKIRFVVWVSGEACEVCKRVEDILQALNEGFEYDLRDIKEVINQKSTEENELLKKAFVQLQMQNQNIPIIYDNVTLKFYHPDKFLKLEKINFDFIFELMHLVTPCYYGGDVDKNTEAFISSLSIALIKLMNG